MIDRFEHFTHATNEISRFWRKLAAEELEKHGLKGMHAMYFTVLAKHPDGLTAPRICEYCGRDKGEVSRMMGILEEKAFVVKIGGHQNRYNGIFRLTEAGHEVAAQVTARAVKAVSLAGKDLTEEQREIFYSALDSITENLRILCEKGIPEDEA